MSKEKLLELVEKSDEHTRRMNAMLYWETPDGKRLSNVYVARWYERAFNCWVKFVASPEAMKDYKTVLSNGDVNMDYNYSADIVHNLNQEYEHVALLYSGGYDSQRIFMDHIENGLDIDETVMHFYTDTEDFLNEEFRENAFPSLHKYKDRIGKQTFLYPHENDVLNHFSDPWAFFKRPSTGCIMENVGFYCIESFYNGADPYDTPVPHNYTKKLDMNPRGCYIMGKDKPQLVYYKQRWYVTCIDQIIGDRGGLQNTVYWWMHPQNIKSLVKESRQYRQFILDYEYGIDQPQYNKFNLQDPKLDVLGTLAFFKFYAQDEYNYIIGRPKIFGADCKLDKIKKLELQRSTIINADRWDIICYYARCMETFFDIFPECRLEGFENFTNQGKFAWFIDIDSLEIYTQQELIPNGFEDITSTRVQGLEKEDLIRVKNWQGFMRRGESHMRIEASGDDVHTKQIRKLKDQKLIEDILTGS